MTHPTEESGVGDANDIGLAPASIEDRFSGVMSEEPEEEEVQASEQDQPEEGETPAPEEGEAETSEEEGEAESPPIAAPNSFTEEEKAEFAGLPRPMQEALARREADRDRAFHIKTQEASRAKTDAERAVIAKAAEIERQSLEQLNQLATLFMPQAPDERLLYGDDRQVAEYNRQKAIHDRALAQLGRAAQERETKLNAYSQELHSREAEAFRQTLSEQFPEYLDPVQSPKHQQELASIARDLGYSDDLIASAGAPDILAMRKAAEWKRGHDKWKAIEAKKMEGVRAAKQLPKVAKPGTALPKGAANAERYQADRAAMRRGDKDAGIRTFSRFI